MKMWIAVQRIMKLLRTAVHNVLFFPAVLTLLLILLTTFSISGSSVGIYHDIFYGNSNDPHLLANQPKAIRSDEWLVGTQKTIAQANNHYKTVNGNVGTGEDESVLVDNPTTDWSVAFRPENLAFFVLPFDHAFAFRWWIPVYSLMISVYVFILVFMPRKRLVASLLAIAFAFSPFMQWWGAYMPAAWLLLGFIVFTRLFHVRKLIYTALWGALLAYMAICFALILYPPYQIPAALAVGALALGYAIEHRDNIASRKILLQKIVVLAGGGIVAIGVMLVFLKTHQHVINTIQNTAYPGHRVVESGAYGKANFFTGSLDGLLQNSVRASNFPYAANQSEASNFILVSPFIVVPLIGLAYSRFRQQKRLPYMLMFPLLIGLLFLAWLFVPNLGLIGKFTLLNIVPPQRLIYGVGILDLILVVLFMKYYQESKWKLEHKSAVIYSLIVMMFLLCVNFYVSTRAPAFIGFRWAIILSLPLAAIVYFLLRKQYAAAMAILSLFSFLSVYKIQPLYVGLSIIRDSEISRAMIKVADQHDPKQKWVTDYIYMENFATMNGLPSLSGTYIYPQLDIWKRLQPGKTDTYNRYEHVTFTFDRNSEKNIKPVLTNPGPDQLNVKIEPCDPFFKTMGVGYLLTTSPFRANTANCLNLATTVKYPQVTFYIYQIK